MHNFYQQNLTGICLDNAIHQKIIDAIEKWQNKNAFCVYMIIKNAEQNKKYAFKFEKSCHEHLQNGVEINLLKASIDLIAQKSEQLGKDLELLFCVGFTKEYCEKVFANSNAHANADDEDAEKLLNVEAIEPKYALNQVILQEDVQNEIFDVISLLKNMQKIYFDWGFAQIDPVPRSIVNLWGPPGTGKTMTVHAIAKEMNKKLLVLNYADIESKYVGEAPKNLVAAFDKASAEDAVIFFDEADSFLGKRITNVNSGSEQAINSLRSQMLMKLEEFSGIVFFATNLHENYDKAFESRILKHIEFKLPTLDARKQIIASKLPTKAPYANDVKNADGTINDELLTELATIIDGFSGREIKNCVLEALVQAAKQDATELTKQMLVNTFSAKKQAFDALKQKEKDKKDKLSKEVKKNLDEKNYNIKSTEENDKE